LHLKQRPAPIKASSSVDDGDDYESPNISLNDDNIKFDFADPDYQQGEE
jgi:hypothetical protein